MHQPNARLETFCDGVFAIAITLLILEIKVPSPQIIHDSDSLFHALLEDWPSWFAFVLSFGTILIAWVNHHSAMKLVRKSSGLFMFTNGLFLFTIVLLPFPTTLLAEFINTAHVQTVVMFYCFAIVLQNISWTLLFQSMLRPKDLAASATARKVILKTRTQCMYAFLVYLGIFTLAYWFPILALILMAVLWIVWILVGLSINEENVEQATVAD